MPYVKVCGKTGGGQVRAHCRQLVFRALRGSAVKCDDWAHLDWRGDLDSGAARQPYSMALSCRAPAPVPLPIEATRQALRRLARGCQLTS